MKKKRLNVVFIIIDALRRKNLGAYGYRPSFSPFIDDLASRSLVFDNAYTVTSKTDPATSSMFSGFYPRSLGLVNHGPRVQKEELKRLEQATLLQEFLQKSGYKTMAVDWLGRWHKTGFNYYSGNLTARSPKEKSKLLYKVPILRYLRFLDTLFFPLTKRDAFTRLYYCLYNKPQIPYDPADKVVDKAVELLRKNKKNPFFLYLHFWDVHIPHTRPRGARSFFLDSVERRYNQEINFVDKNIGRLFKSLKKEECFIILTADHGEALGEHGLYLDHQKLYEEVLRVPLMIFHPGFSAKKVKAPVQHVDLVPTILDTLKVKAGINFDGKSLLPLIRGKKKKIHEFLYFEDLYAEELRPWKKVHCVGIRSGSYKFIRSYTGKKTDVFKVKLDRKQLTLLGEELYNVEKDPGEKRNIISENFKVAELLRKELDVFLDKEKEILSGGKTRQRKSDKQEVMERLRQLGYF